MTLIIESRLEDAIDLVDKYSERMNLDQQDVTGWTVMMLAVLFYDDSMNRTLVEHLLDKGADVHIQSKLGESAIHYAAHMGRDDIL